VDASGMNESFGEQLQRGLTGTLKHDQTNIARPSKLLGDQSGSRVAACDDKCLGRRSPRVVAERSVLERPIVDQ
jgi:hypothetical protein